MKAAEILLAVLEKRTPGERAAYLEVACGADVALRTRVEGLLKAHEEAGSFLEQPLFETAATLGPVPDPEKSGAVLGPYRLLQPIGEGGMGAVWQAEQKEPVRRTVALKILKPGMDSRQVLGRFEAERQTLALMDHPNIARVLDAGTTASGRPYLVMELVQGVPITRYCDEHRLTPRQRLELFVPVCQAVQHAHQKGIIHRDLKPSNVLVARYDDRPVPKVIDFGVAKVTGPQLTEQTLHTGFGTVVGTAEYMSPEQASLNQLDVDTRSDIYSLGVLVYELLTGTPPFTRKELAKAGPLELLRVIREQEPSKPSTKLSTAEGLATLAANRGTEATRLTNLVRGELDWIVMKCLEKDRNGRYDTAIGLAADVQRYLDDKAVQACPPSMAYRFRKFARRNKAGLGMAIVIAVALLLVVGALGWLACDYAARRAAIDGEVSRILQEALELREQRKYAEALSAARRAVERAADGARWDTRDQARAVREDLEMVQRVDEIRLVEGTLTERDSFDFTDVDRAYARAFRDYGIDVEDLEPAEAAQRIRARSIPVELAAALDDWARASWASRGRRDGCWRNLLAIARLADPDLWRDRLRDAYEKWYARAPVAEAFEQLASSAQIDQLPPSTLALLGQGLADVGSLETAVSVLLRAQRRCPGDFWINFYLAWCYDRLQPPQSDEAIRFLQAALVARPRSAAAYNNLGVAFAKKGRLDDAIAAYREAIRLKPTSRNPHRNLVPNLLAKDRVPEALAEYREALRLRPDRPLPDGEVRSLATALYRRGETTEARRLQEPRIDSLRAALQQDPKNQSHAEQLRRHLWVLADNAHLKHDELARIAEEFPRLFPDLEDECVRAAWYLCRCTSEVQKDDELPEEERSRLAQRYSDRAVEMLRQAIAKGNKDVNRFKTEPVFAPLRSRADFQELVAELERKAP
jgi:serine/threonine protein kinase/tetratricopeptide (TPR) repeat protein